MSRKPAQKVRAPTKKITGHRGQWTAEVEGVELGVLQLDNRVGTNGYFDPMEGTATGDAKHARLAAALQANDVAVMQKKRGTTAQDSFVGLFSYKDLEIGDDGSIKLTFVDRVQ